MASPAAKMTALLGHSLMLPELPAPSAGKASTKIRTVSPAAKPTALLASLLLLTKQRALVALKVSTKSSPVNPAAKPTALPDFLLLPTKPRARLALKDSTKIKPVNPAAKLTALLAPLLLPKKLHARHARQAWCNLRQTTKAHGACIANQEHILHQLLKIVLHARLANIFCTLPPCAYFVLQDLPLTRTRQSVQNVPMENISHMPTFPPVHVCLAVKGSTQKMLW